MQEPLEHLLSWLIQCLSVVVDVAQGLGEVGWERVSGCEGVSGDVDGDGAVAACGADQASDGPAGGGLQPAGHGRGLR